MLFGGLLRKARKIKCATLNVQLANLLMLAFFVIFFGVYCYYYPIRQKIVSVLLVLIVGFTVLAYLFGEYLSSRIGKNEDLEDVEKCRYYVMIWSGGISVVGIVNLAVTYYLGMSSEVFSIISMFINVSLPLIFSCSILTKLPLFYIIYDHHGMTTFFGILIHLLCFFASAAYAIKTTPPPFAQYPIFIHIWFLITCAPCSFDFLIAMNCGIRLGDLDEINGKKKEEKWAKYSAGAKRSIESSAVWSYI